MFTAKSDQCSSRLKRGHSGTQFQKLLSGLAGRGFFMGQSRTQLLIPLVSGGRIERMFQKSKEGGGADLFTLCCLDQTDYSSPTSSSNLKENKQKKQVITHNPNPKNKKWHNGKSHTRCEIKELVFLSYMINKQQMYHFSCTFCNPKEKALKENSLLIYSIHVIQHIV